MTIFFGALPTAASLNFILYCFVEHYAEYVQYTFENWLKKNKDYFLAASVELLEGQIKVKWLKFSPFLFTLCLALKKYVHLSCQRSPDSCFETSSWTHYDVTVHHVRTHTIYTILAFFKVLILFYFAVLSSVTSSLVGVSSIGIMFYHHCPIITLFQLHAFQFSSFQFGQVCRQHCGCTFVDSGFSLDISMVVGLVVFSLVELTSYAVVNLIVLEFRSIVEILSFPFIFIVFISNARKENNCLPQWPIFY